ncbi:MAG TPA: phosphoethanolamine transferase CptA [Pseudomonadales bacterium]|nr:phosphoethanolamine transferase CptA [Pseudomonadales bacterium]
MFLLSRISELLKSRSLSLRQPGTLNRTLAIYLFFGWFSLTPQMLFIFQEFTGWTGLRDATLYTLCWLLLPAVLPKKWLPTTLAAVGCLMAACALAKLGNYWVFHQELSQSVFVATLESNPQEVREFLQQYFSWRMIPAAILYCLPAIYFYRQIVQNQQPMPRVTYAVISLVLLSYPYISHGMGDAGIKQVSRKFIPVEPWGMLINYSNYRDNLLNSSHMQDNMQAAAQRENIVTSDTNAEKTYVLVIGESTSRKRLSLYGYARPTSPRLQEISNELLVYDNVVSNIPYTIESLSTALSFTNPEDLAATFSHMNIITMMKNAGFKTYWITNQQTLTNRNTMLNAFSGLTDEHVYLNNNLRQSATSYDEKVLKPFEAALQDKDPKKLIIVHLLGAHFSYRLRYPESFSVFDNQNPPSSSLTDTDEDRFNYNAYDNAVLYNDHIVRELIETYRAHDPYGFMVYFSDHGEEVFDTRDFNGRDMSKPTINMYEVPFIIWPSPRWTAQHDMSALKNTVHRPSSLSLFLHSWCSLASITYRECKEKNSLLSNKFEAQPRWVGIGNNRHSYEDLLKNTSQVPQ